MEWRNLMEKITIESLFDLKNVSQPIYLDGNIFFLETKMDQKTNTYMTQIYSLDTVTKEMKAWGDSSNKNLQLAVSPNGKWLSYVSANNPEKTNQVMVMSTSGGRATQLTFEKDGVNNYLWTANSSSLFFQTSEKNQVEEESSQTEKATDFPEIVAYDKVTYKLDGAGILPTNRHYLLKKVERATQAVQTIYKQESSFNVSYVSKDESYFIYQDELDKTDEWTYGSTVYLYDLASQKSRSLTISVPKGSFSYSAMSPDERFLLLEGNDFEYAFVTQTKLYGYDLVDNKLICLTATHDLEVGDLIIGDFQQQIKGVSTCWLNEEEYLFGGTEHGKLQLYRGDRSGHHELIFDQRVHLTDSYLIKGKEQLVVTYSTTTKPSELGIIDLVSGELTSLYNPNQRFVEETEISEPEMFWYKGADDWDIQGWYLPPIEVKKNHPAILYVHGGPQVCYGESFFHEMQVHAANGYGVILLNPRGGNGYGQEFVASILGDYGNKDYQDLMLGVDAVLAKHPEISEEQVYVAGGSYGGFMTNWIVGHTNRFKAAITQRSISNWISFYGTSDIGPFFVKFQLQRELDDVEGLWAMSPLAHANNAQTPLLVLHGQADLRCPQEQGEQFYMAMKRKGVETKMITFPQSSHGLSRIGLPNLRVKRLENIVEWFATH